MHYALEMFDYMIVIMNSSILASHAGRFTELAFGGSTERCLRIIADTESDLRDAAGRRRPADHARAGAGNDCPERRTRGRAQSPYHDKHFSKDKARRIFHPNSAAENQFVASRGWLWGNLA